MRKRTKRMEFEQIIHEFAASSKGILNDNLLGVYLHGSAAMGCFNPAKSDIDLIVVIKDPMDGAAKRAFMEMTVRLNALGPKKGIEMSVVRQAACRPFIYPTPYELHFSAGHLPRYLDDPEEYIREMNGTDRDLAAHFTVIRRRGRCLFGPPIEEVFAEVPKEDYLDSIRRDVEDAREDLLDNPVYFVLNLARVLACMKDGTVLSKKEGGEWALGHLPPEYRAVVRTALEEYTKGVDAAYDPAATKAYADYMLEQLLPKQEDFTEAKQMASDILEEQKEIPTRPREEIVSSFYAGSDENTRLQRSRHGQLEFRTTMAYIHRYADARSKVLEVGAGTGRYSVALAKEGMDVTAVELAERHLAILRENGRGLDNLRAYQGDATELGRFPDGAFDATLVLGPMYHLYTPEEVDRAIDEAIRVTRPGGVLFFAFLSVYAIMYANYLYGRWAFGQEENFTEDYRVKHYKEQLFTGYDVAEFERLFDEKPVEHLATAGTDGPLEALEDRPDFGIPDEDFDAFAAWSLAFAEKRELLGGTSHLLYICRKK